MPRKKRTLGFGFPEEIGKVTFKSGHFRRPEESLWEETLIPNFDSTLRFGLNKSFWRVTLMLGVLAIFFFGLFVRLFHLQITDGDVNRNLADGNRIQIKVIHAPRGVIFDRNGKILAANSPGFRLVDKDRKVSFVSREEALSMEVKNDPRAINLEVDNIRRYPIGEKISHALGYVGEISEDQLKDPGYQNYRIGDKIGQSGIESYYESYLKGIDGGEIIEVDAQGKKLRTLRRIAPKSGQNVYLTIDADLQDQVYKFLKEGVEKSESCCGAAIAINPTNGEVLSLVSIPSFDNNIFSDSQKNDLVREALTSPDAPILNRAIGGTYPPGSTYKIISSIAALESGKVTPQTQIEDTGQIFLGSFKFTNWFFTQYGKTEGSVDLVKALKRSNDIYYYRIGEIVGEVALADWSRKLKLGSTLGLDLEGEAKGLVPDNDWKQKTYSTSWYPGDTLHMAIGQGFVLTTPLQVLGFTSFIAADGNMYKPRLLLKVTGEDGVNIKQVQTELLVSKLISKEKLDVIKKGLSEVTADGGTAWPFFTFPIKTSGKTGTAEFGDKDKTHAWYTSFAPTDNPEITMVVLVEAGGEGSSVAAPITKEIYRWYFSPDKNNLIKDTGQIATDSARIGE